MSGIAGIVRWDQEEISPDLIRQMATNIKHRGADGKCFLVQDNTSFCYLHLNVTYESFHEKQPLPNKDGLILVADARIDNRQELLQLLALNEEDTKYTLPDSQLIMAAYEKWRSDCVDYLVGDFAFAIYDPQNQTVFCVRDHSGVRPFFYHYVPNKYFLFASEIKALWAFPSLTKEIDESRAANYLCHWGQFPIYQHTTFYKGVSSLPPAHYMSVSLESTQKTMYWKVDPSKYSYKTNEEYLAAFKEIFLEAVACRIRTPYGVSSFLSGGLDSSSVAAVASTLLGTQKRQLDTYYIDTELEETSEREYVLPFLNKHPVRHTEVTADKNYYEHLARVARLTDMPEMFSLTYNHFAPLMKKVKEAGSRVLLTGSDGDTIVGYGTECIYEAIQANDWKKAAKLLRQAHNPLDYQKKFGKAEGRKIYSKRMIAMLLWKLPTLVGLSQRWWHFIKGTVLYLHISPLFLLKASFSHFTKKVKEATDYSVHPDLYAKCTPFLKEDPGLPLVTNMLINRGAFYQMMSEVNEYYDIMGAQHQVEICHPFFDKRLIELCFFIPTELKFYEGYGRGPLRAAMQEYLPPAILSRKSKIDFGPYMNKQLADQERDPHDVIRENKDLLEGYIIANSSAIPPGTTKPSVFSRLHHRILYFLYWRKVNNV